MPANFAPTSLDHVALWVDERKPLASFLCDHLGMHVIEETDTFTLVGVDAREGKLTLFDAEGPREPGVLARVVLRVADLYAAVQRLPEGLRLERDASEVSFEAPDGLRLALTEARGVEYDLDHVVLRVPEPDRTATGLAGLGFAQRNGHLSVADRHVRLERGDTGAGERPLLNHLALLVDSAEGVKREAEERGLAIRQPQ